MLFTFNTFALILIVIGAITLFLSFYVFKREGGAVKWFGIMMLSNSIWSVGYGFELASSTLDQIKFFINIEYIGISTLPVCWLVFCLYLSGKEKWYKKKLNALILASISILTMLLVWTNQYHHLHYKDLFISYKSAFPMVVIVPGISYKLFTIYFYLILATGSYLLIAKFRKADIVFKKQNYSIIIAAFIPWLANISYLAGLRPLGNLDLTPFAFMATIVLISLGIYRFNLFDILPVAREKVLELMQDGFIVLDKQFRIIDYNKAFGNYFGHHNRDRLIGIPVEQVFPNQSELIQFIKEHRNGKKEISLSTNQGLFDLEADVRYLNENSLNQEATIVKFQDLTALRQEAMKSKEQASELQRLNQLKDRIFSIISHDLRGPLVNLSEVLKMVTNNLITTEEFKALAPTLSKDILYTTDLLENILHWSRSQLKGYGLNKEPFDLRNLVINEINYHLPSASIKKIEIIHDVFPGVMVYADMLMIQIVVRNILNNAIKFCSERSIIHITAVFQKDKHILLCIKDTGIGISPEIVDRLFSGGNPSTRGTMNEKGTGIGLVVCKEFIERNDGIITVESELGKGTTFCITLPVADT